MNENSPMNTRPIEASELILNSRGAIYHLDCRPEEVADLILTVGDPDRVSAVSRHFDTIEFKNKHREFITHTGTIGRQRISVISTGIGPDNIDIVLNELDALVNINLDTRTVKEQPTALRIIRIGTSGSLQADIPTDSFVASTHGLGLDNLMHFYQFDKNDEERSILQAFVQQTQLNEGVTPYIQAGSVHLLKHFVDGFHTGITVTCPGFYGPQGRQLRLGLSLPSLNDELTSFRFGNHRISNFEMETSAIYSIGKALGHHCLSLSAIVANRVHRTFTQDGNQLVQRLIEKTLDQLTRF